MTICSILSSQCQNLLNILQKFGCSDRPTYRSLIYLNLLIQLGDLNNKLDYFHTSLFEVAFGVALFTLESRGFSTGCFKEAAFYMLNISFRQVPTQQLVVPQWKFIRIVPATQNPTVAAKNSHFSRNMVFFVCVDHIWLIYGNVNFLLKKILNCCKQNSNIHTIKCCKNLKKKSISYIQYIYIYIYIYTYIHNIYIYI